MGKTDDVSGGDRYPVKEYPGWLHRQWLTQRIGAGVLFLIVICGACGLFSKGILSDKTLTSSDGAVTVEYERFGRILSSMDMVIRVNTMTSSTFSITLGKGGVEKLQIQSLHPQPLRAETRGNDLILTFAASQLNAGHTLWLGMQPERSGTNTMSVQVDSRPPVEFSQFIYP